MFNKLKITRDLSPNVWKRFEDYELKKKEKLLKMRIANYMEENKKVPRAEDLMRVEDEEVRRKLDFIIGDLVGRDLSPFKK